MLCTPDFFTKIKQFGCVLLLFILASCSKKENIGPIRQKTGIDSLSNPISFSLSPVLQSNMVVQRDKPFVIWGKATPQLKITINVSWNLQSFNTKADASGNWKLSVPASPANTTSQNIIVKPANGDAVILNNVLIGDVWICAGQSNMAMPVDSIAPFSGVLNYKAEIAVASYQQIRTFVVIDDYEATPITSFSLPSAWNVCSPATVGATSAISYYFARKLNTTLNVPIGIIISAINGSYCQDWTNMEAIQNNPALNPQYLPGSAALYNGMINPLVNLSIKGYTWYQGENNQHDYPVSGYTGINSALINGWRDKFNQGQLPFYFVQLTPFAEDYNSTKPPGGDLLSNYLAKFREAQANILSVPGTGMAITMDVGEAGNHHPRNKKPVGERLALLALKNTYGQSVACYGPQYASFSTNNYTATVYFTTGTANGLNTIGNKTLNQFFFVAGADKVFRQGVAKISGSTIIISAPANTPLPVQAIRYAFTNAPITNLQNSAGLPAEPFRTDTWGN